MTTECWFSRLFWTITDRFQARVIITILSLSKITMKRRSRLITSRIQMEKLIQM